MPRMNFSSASVVQISFDGTYLGSRLSFVNQNVILDDKLNIIAVSYNPEQFVSWQEQWQYVQWKLNKTNISGFGCRLIESKTYHDPVPWSLSDIFGVGLPLWIETHFEVPGILWNFFQIICQLFYHILMIFDDLSGCSEVHWSSVKDYNRLYPYRFWNKFYFL